MHKETSVQAINHKDEFNNWITGAIFLQHSPKTSKDGIRNDIPIICRIFFGKCTWADLFAEVNAETLCGIRYIFTFCFIGIYCSSNTHENLQLSSSRFKHLGKLLY